MKAKIKKTHFFIISFILLFISIFSFNIDTNTNSNLSLYKDNSNGLTYSSDVQVEKTTSNSLFFSIKKFNTNQGLTIYDDSYDYDFYLDFNLTSHAEIVNVIRYENYIVDIEFKLDNLKPSTSYNYNILYFYIKSKSEPSFEWNTEDLRIIEFNQTLSFKTKYEFFYNYILLSVFVLLFLFIVSLVIYFILNSKTKKRNKQLEEKLNDFN